MFGSSKKSANHVTGGKSGAGGLSFIGADVTVNGDLVSNGQLHVDGRINGDVRCDTLIQGEGGTISGQIEVATAHLAGLVDGTVRARVVTLDPSARVTGDVNYETLSIAAGATIEGRLTRKEAGVAAEPIALETKTRPAKMTKAVKAEAGKAGPATPAPEPGLLAISASAAGGSTAGA